MQLIASHVPLWLECDFEIVGSTDSLLWHPADTIRSSSYHFSLKGRHAATIAFDTACIAASAFVPETSWRGKVECSKGARLAENMTIRNMLAAVVIV